MSVTERVQADVAAAMKAGDKGRVGALRLVVSELQLARKEAADGFGEQEEIAVLQRERKKRIEAAEAFKQGGRPEQAAAEEAEAELISGYLPAQLSDAELGALVDEAVAAAGATSPQDMGKVMGGLMAKVGGRADGKRVSALVRERLSGGA